MTAVQDSKETASTEVVDSNQGPTWLFWRRRRYIVAFLAFLGFFNVYALRVNLSVAIVAMTANRTVQGENGTVSYVQDFDWDSKTQGLILSSFFYGYIVTQIPGGWLAMRVGGNRMFGIGLAATAFFTLLTPPLAHANVYLLVAVRVIEGLFEGVTYPCMHAVWAQWAPPLERSRMTSLAFSGSYVGTVVAMPLCGFLAKEVGWPSIFYVFGTICLVWFAVWWMVVAESPEKDPKITPEELKYIQDSLGKSSNGKKVVHPWKKFATSMPVYAIVVAHFCENWGFYTLLTQLPTFMKDTLHFDLKEAGVMSALPYLAMALILQIAGHLADFLMSRGILNTTQVRRTFNCGAFLCQTVFMLLATVLYTPAGVVSCLTVAVGLGAFALSGYGVNHLDIAPQHASVLMGISNTVGTLPGIISPLVMGFIVQNKSAAEWKVVFYIASSVYLFGVIVYGLFASGELQPWAKQPDPEKKEEHAYTNTALEM
ncbi:vesicular glutamate transporter 2 [Anabrus simplex]|uniref:vesicular glutamate transporter 2 n=1 Tax=Anabrus simplex TaxID=316456 RepID=UPI0035A2F592